ncbi:MAG TPA: SDR family oxidoreductase [Gemmatimonadaceae bacterium]|nr:SDR family oxidoreductase [Gemmatimonadaceae bacterium]
MFTGSTIVLTGVGGEGQVGEVVAQAFAEQGASLVLVDRTADKVEARAAAIVASGHSARGYACDLTNADSVADLVDRVRANHGDTLHGLVHMAGGFAMSGPVGESSIDVWNRMIAINLNTAYLTTRAFLALLRKGHGSIVLFSSEAALPGAKAANRSAYAIAKIGVATLMRAIAQEERATGVRANAVAPTSIRTAANIASMGDGVRYIEREAVADVVLFLCSQAASAISGELLPLT